MVARGYKMLERVTGSYRLLQRVTGDARGYRGL